MHRTIRLADDRNVPDEEKLEVYIEIVRLYLEVCCEYEPTLSRLTRAVPGVGPGAAVLQSRSCARHERDAARLAAAVQDVPGESNDWDHGWYADHRRAWLTFRPSLTKLR